MRHGYVSFEGNIERIRPPGQLAIKSLEKLNQNFDVGKRTYKFEGDAGDIVNYLESKPEMIFTAHTMGADGQWGVGKDANNANIVIAFNKPDTDEKPKNHLRMNTDNIGKVAAAFVSPLGLVKEIFQGGSLGIRTEIGKFKAAKKLLAAGTANATVGPTVEPKSISGKLRRVHSDLTDRMKKSGVTKLPFIGEKIDKAISISISLTINPYMPPNRLRFDKIAMGKPRATFEELAAQIRIHILGEKQDNHNEVSTSSSSETSVAIAPSDSRNEEKKEPTNREVERKDGSKNCDLNE